MNTKIQWKPLLISLLISLGVGFLSYRLTPDIRESYNTLYKPLFAPPGWLFPIVWTILYVLMGIAAYLIYLSPMSRERTEALFYYGAQLLVNLLWPVIFFRLEAYSTAFFWLLLLGYLVWVTREKFAALSQTAGRLLVPYLVWLLYAGYLNLVIAVAER